MKLGWLGWLRLYLGQALNDVDVHLNSHLSINGQ
jgi:hypothetical protein